MTITVGCSNVGKRMIAVIGSLAMGLFAGVLFLIAVSLGRARATENSDRK